jgi:hypothetical protein
MTRKLLLPFLLLLLVSTKSDSQDYSTYYTLINKAEEQFITKMDSTCFQDYDRAFKQYKPFLKDPYLASQIALYLGDTTRFYNYLIICFQNGMPLTAVNTSNLIKKVNKIAIKNKISGLHKKHFKAIQYDQDLRDKISLMCYQSDSLKLKKGGRSREFYQNESESRQYILDSFLLQGKFPNELLFGISTNQTQDDFQEKFNRDELYPSPFPQANTHYEEFELRLKCPYNIILHSRCFYTDHKDLFRKAMLNGYIHPKEIGILEETAIIWYKRETDDPSENCKEAIYKTSYNIFGRNPMHSEQIFDDSEEGLRIVEANRSGIFMQKYSIDQKKKLLEQETGIKFFFDFVDR